MKINLRKANAIQMSIQDVVKSLDFATVVHVNPFENSVDQIDDARSAWEKNLTVRKDLNGALYAIRKAVARENARVGINDLLADVAQLEKDIQFYTNLCNTPVQMSNAVIEGNLEKLRNSTEDRRLFRSETVETGIFTRAELENYRRMVADLKRKKQELKDTLLELNVRTEVDLDEDTARILERADIL